MKKINTILLSAGFLLSTSTIMAYAPADYYTTLDGKSGTDLKKAVKAIARKGFKAIAYGENGTWKAFQSTDVRTVDGKEYWWDMYSSNNVPVSSGHGGMNIEHTVANSWWGGTKSIDAYKDIVHLNPSNSDANSRKGNYPIGEISGASTWNNGITFIGHPVSGQGGGCTMVYEPHDMYKGDFARVYMYMFIAYDDISWEQATSQTTDGKGRMYTFSGSVAELQPWAYNLMLSWSASDPVSEKEINRNNGIYKEQGNRNPFIDLPDLADYIWGSKKNETYHLDGDHNPIPNPDEEDPDPEIPEPVEPDDPVIEYPDSYAGKFVLVTKDADIVDEGKYIIVSSESHSTMSTTLGNKCLSPTTQSVNISDNTIATAPGEAAIVTLEGTNNGYKLHLHDVTGKSLGYLASAKTKTISVEDDSDAAGTTATLKVDGDETTVTFGTAGNYVYNPSAKMFRTYSSSTGGMETLNFYRLIPDQSTNVLPIEKDRFRVIVRDNNILAPAGSYIFDLNGRRVSGSDLESGLYIVVAPEKEKTVKVIISK